MVREVSNDFDEISVRDLMRTLWAGRHLVIIISTAFLLVGSIYSLTLPNLYRADILLAPSEDSVNKVFGGGLEGIASLAGVNLAQGGTDKTQLALKVLTSKRFVKTFVEKYQFTLPLLAAEAWDAEVHELRLDSKLVEKINSLISSDVEGEREFLEIQSEAYSAFISRLSVNWDAKSGFVYLSFDHESPVFGKKVLVSLVNEINDDIKSQDIGEANRRLAYLDSQLKMNSIQEMRDVFYGLLEEQMKIVMFADARKEYVFKIIDPPVLPLKPVSPSRLVISVMSLSFGFVFSGLFVLGRAYLSA